MRSGFLKLSCYQSHPTLTFGQTEATFHFHPFALVLMRLSLFRLRILLRSAKRGAGKADMMFFAVRQIGAGPIDFV